MRVKCQYCGKIANAYEAKGWKLDHWLGYKFEEKEVIKLGLCSSCLSKILRVQQ